MQLPYSSSHSRRLKLCMASKLRSFALCEKKPGKLKSIDKNKTTTKYLCASAVVVVVVVVCLSY
jgi:hypothetical protein